MSVKTYVEAMEFVLDTELDARQELICFRPGARRAFGEVDRDVPLPRIGRKSFSIALGAALQGAHPVLDLRQENGAAQLLADALMELPVGMAPVMTVIACAEDRELLMDLPGVYVFEPKTPRQAAGFLRSALKMPKLTVVLADQALFAEEDDIPEERSFALLPLDGEEEGNGSEETTEEDEPICADGDADSEEEAEIDEAYDETEEACKGAEEAVRMPLETSEIYEADEELAEETEDPCEQAPVKREYAFLATRQTACDLTQLRSLSGMLEMDIRMLAERCAEHVQPVFKGFEMHCEMDAPEGEAAFIPPVEESASLWLGGNMLTIAYDAAQMDHTGAASLLRAMKRVLEMPQLLIYDKEQDEARMGVS